MNPLPFHILLALAAADGTGAEVWRRTQEDLRSTLALRERSFYTALQSLAAKGWVASAGAGRAAVYHLTPQGRRRLQEDNMRLAQAVRLLQERL